MKSEEQKMYAHIRPNYLVRNELIKMSRPKISVPPKLVNQNKVELPKRNKRVMHQQRITEDLRKLGVSSYGFMKLSVRHLPRVIHPDEQIQGIVYGRHTNGSAVLVATDRRALF